MVLFPINEGAASEAPLSPLKWVEEFRYPGVLVTKNHFNYVEKNLTPVMTTLHTKCSAWADLPLNLLGRINLLKMVMLPKFNYLFRNRPVWVPVSFFREIDRCVGFFI